MRPEIRMNSPPSSIRVGTGAGFSDDRIEPAVELAERGGVDYLVFECLAERTIARETLTRKRTRIAATLRTWSNVSRRCCPRAAATASGS